MRCTTSLLTSAFAGPNYAACAGPTCQECAKRGAEMITETSQGLRGEMRSPRPNAGQRQNCGDLRLRMFCGRLFPG